MRASGPFHPDYTLIAGFNGNIGYGMFAVIFAAPALFLQCLVYMRMWYLSETESSRNGLIPAAFMLAFDATLMLGFHMHASCCCDDMQPFGCTSTSACRYAKYVAH